MGIKLVCLKDCVNQDDGKRLVPGDIIEFSELEASRHLAEGNCKLIETESMEIPEVRIRRGRK